MSRPVLYYSRNFNPRVAVAVARYLGSDVEFVHAAPADPAEAERFRPLNPNLRVPILVEDGRPLWETDAIACRLSQLAGSEFWRTGDELPGMIQWLSWGRSNFVAACDKVHFERVTRPRYGLRPLRPELLADGLAGFAEGAALLDRALEGREWLVGDRISYADFRMASVLPYADLAGLSLRGFPRVAAWYWRLERIDAWRDPFAGLDAPPLPPAA